MSITSRGYQMSTLGQPQVVGLYKNSKSAQSTLPLLMSCVSGRCGSFSSKALVSGTSDIPSEERNYFKLNVENISGK